MTLLVVNVTPNWGIIFLQRGSINEEGVMSQGMALAGNLAANLDTVPEDTSSLSESRASKLGQL